MCSFPTWLIRLQENSSTMPSEKSKDTSPLLHKEKVNPVGYYFELIARPCLVEFIGTLLFVFIGCMSVQDALTVQPPASPYVPSATAVAIAHGLTITALIMSFGSVSGGHFNPAITFGVALSGGISPILAFGYFISQILGGIGGAALCRGVLSDTAYEKIYGGAHILSKLDPGRAILCETIITTILVLTVIMVAVEESTKNKFSPLAIGFAATVGTLAAINSTGGSMNPARSFGPALMVSVTTDANAFLYHYVFWVGPAAGAMLAALLYRLAFASASRRLIFREAKI